MSGNNSILKPQGADSHPRRSLSFHDKMEDARLRRAAALSADKPANLPRKAVKSAAPSTPRIDMAESAPAPKPEPIKANEPAPSPRRKPRVILQALALLLLALVMVAYSQGRGLAPLTAAAFHPPMVSLQTPATPVAKPATFSPAAVPGLTREEPSLVSSPEADVLPATLPAAPAPHGPRILDLIDTLAAPPARPAGLVTMSGDALPDGSPSDAG